MPQGKIEPSLPKTIPNSKLLENYSLAIDWLNSMDIKVAPGRFHTYRKTLETSVSKAPETFSNEEKACYIQALYECNELLYVYDRLNSELPTDIRGVVEALQKAATGPAWLPQEITKNSAARNYMFQACIAAKLHHTSLGSITIDAGLADGIFQMGQNSLTVECKRLFSPTSLRKNLKKALAQVKNRTSSNPLKNEFGLIAVDVSRNVSGPGDILPCRDYRELTEATRGHFEKWLHNHREYLHETVDKAPERILGALLRVSLLGIAEKENKYLHINEWTFMPGKGRHIKFPQLMTHLQKVLTENTNVGPPLALPHS